MKKRGFAFLTLFVVLFMTAISASAGVDRVLCVPWEGDPAKYHTAISGQSVELTAVIYGDATGGIFSYSWEFFDGSAAATGSITVPANGIYNLKVAHTFSGAGLGATFPTELTIDGITDVYNIIIGPDNTGSKTNIAIDKGLWYLHTQMIRGNHGSPAVPGGYWNDDYNYYVGRTGACVWAFEVQGHLLPVESDPLAPEQDPYVETVQRGINYILSRTYSQSMTHQTNGWPEDYDGNNSGNDGNGIGLFSYQNYSHTVYENGPAIGAIAGSGAPLATADTGDAAWVLGRTYKDIVQDMADWYSWAQLDGSVFPPSGARGGWYYTANYGTSGTYGDNSAAQWAYIGLDAAESNFGSSIPKWVKEQTAVYLHNQISYGNRGSVGYRANETYTAVTYSTANVCLTGGALVGMALVGETIYDDLNGSGSYNSDINLVKTFMGLSWEGTANRYKENWYGHRAYYTMYAVMKGFRLQGIASLPGLPGTTDWYKDYVGVMLPDQYADGHWRGTGWMDGYIESDMGTAFGVLILTPSVFSPPPNACFTAEPNPGYLDIPITLDPACSYHSDAGKTIVLYEWDLDNDGEFDDASSTTPEPQTRIWDSGTYGLGTYPVSLRVTDDSATPVTDTYTLDVDLTTPPHPPVADSGGPYMVSLCAGDSLTLDGSGSYDIDEGQSESGSAPFDTITQYEWDLNGAPWTYPVDALDNEIFVVDSSGFSAGTVQMSLRVTDNTELAYPGSQVEDKTDEDFTSLTVYPACEPCGLAAYVKSGKVSLVWADTGAASYDIYRSTTGPNAGFELIADDHVSTYATYLDLTVTNGVTYYYRIISSDGCGSTFVVAKPVATRRTR